MVNKTFTFAFEGEIFAGQFMVKDHLLPLPGLRDFYITYYFYLILRLGTPFA